MKINVASPKSSPKERTLNQEILKNPLLWRGRGEALTNYNIA
jgi:hypothetical protein